MRIGWIVAFLLIVIAPAFAQDSDTDLATKLSNPVASLVSVPFQFNYDCCFGPRDSDRTLLNLQPVIPFKLSDDWNLIVRTIVPVIDQPSPVAGGGTAFGLGDTTQSFFLSPNSAPGDLIWAVGPVFLWPTATETDLGNHKWGAGLTGLLLEQQHGWTYGILANHVWSYGGEGEYPNVSRTFLQPFAGYTWPDTTSLTLNLESTYDWQAKQWSVPVNLVLGHLFRFGKQPVSFQFGGRYYADRPQDTASWGLRFGIVFLFPKG